MTNLDLIILVVLFFATSVVGVVTGSNSLITVPVMFQFGIEEKRAIATNMFGLTFMAIGATIPFIRQGKIEPRKLTPLIVLTIVGSALGALLVGYITNQSIRLIVSIAMFIVVVFTLLRPRPSTAAEKENDPALRAPLLRKEGSFYLGLAVTFLLAIYGGLYSGGYVTILTAAFVAFLGMNYAESVGSTKLVNVFSSGVATVVFMWQGLVDYSLGAILAVTMFAGAYVGAHYAAKMNEVWLKRIFLATVVLLAIKTLYDFAA
ncbi:MAG TPA: sulfite exporter TauE/SafE family protein [Pyrinomonadaceae bacterium]|nr:sulfite exporter TauE/SafE family protein [Pyrinomonadaceae bacterium]